MPQLFAIQPFSRRLDAGLDCLRLSIANWAGGNCCRVAVAISLAALAKSASAGVFILPSQAGGAASSIGAGWITIPWYVPIAKLPSRAVAKKLSESEASTQLKLSTSSNCIFHPSGVCGTHAHGFRCSDGLNPFFEAA